jgi:hypothetical protein
MPHPSEMDIGKRLHGVSFYKRINYYDGSPYHVDFQLSTEEREKCFIVRDTMPKNITPVRIEGRLQITYGVNSDLETVQHSANVLEDWLLSIGCIAGQI